MFGSKITCLLASGVSLASHRKCVTFPHLLGVIIYNDGHTVQCASPDVTPLTCLLSRLPKCPNGKCTVFRTNNPIIGVVHGQLDTDRDISICCHSPEVSEIYFTLFPSRPHIIATTKGDFQESSSPVLAVGPAPMKRAGLIELRNYIHFCVGRRRRII